MQYLQSFECQAIFRYNFARGLSIDECFLEMRSALGDDCPSSDVVSQWYTRLTGDLPPEDVVDDPVNIVVDPMIAQQDPKTIFINGDFDINIFQESEANQHMLENMDKNTFNGLGDIYDENFNLAYDGNDWHINERFVTIKEEPFDSNSEDPDRILLDINTQKAEFNVVKKKDNINCYHEDTTKDNKILCNDELDKTIKNKQVINEVIDFNENSSKRRICKTTEDCAKQENVALDMNKDLKNNSFDTFKHENLTSKVFENKKTSLSPIFFDKNKQTPIDNQCSSKCFACKYCGQTFKWKNSMQRHLNFACVKLKAVKNDIDECKYSCQQCEHKFRSERLMDQHLSRFHSDLVNSFNCKTCCSSYPTLESLQEHSKTGCSNNVIFKCLSCDYKTGLRFNLSKHIAKMHKISEKQTNNNTSSSITQKPDNPINKSRAPSKRRRSDLASNGTKKPRLQ